MESAGADTAIVPFVRPGGRAKLGVWIVRGLGYVALAMAIWALFDFNTLEHRYCHGTQPGSSFYCDMVGVSCVPEPAKCTPSWRGFVAENRFHLASINGPGPGFSFLDFVWMLFVFCIACIINGWLFLVYLVREPILTEPFFWLVLEVVAAIVLEPKVPPVAQQRNRPASPPHNRAGRESPLGEARAATLSDAHAGLQGSSPGEFQPPQFED